MHRIVAAAAATVMLVAVALVASPWSTGLGSATSADPGTRSPSGRALTAAPLELIATTPTPAPTATPSPAPPPYPDPWVAPSDEDHPEAKELGAAIAQALTTHDPGATVDAVVAPLTDDPSLRARLREAAAPLVHDGHWSRGTVLYPQMGGYRNDRASIMVVVRQDVGMGDEVVRTETRTLDVRVVRKDGAWQLEGLASVGGQPVERPADLPAAAIAVLDHPGIWLPDSARWDIHRGVISVALLEIMAELADRTPYAVTVLESGHPHHVFETTSVSRHTVGQAVDIHRLGSRTISADRADGSPTMTIARWLDEHPGVANLGSPWALDDGGGRSFTDTVHQDHLHVAVTS